MTRLIVTTETSITLDGATTPVTLPVGYYEYDGPSGTLLLPSNQFIPRSDDSSIFALGLIFGVLCVLVLVITLKRG